MADGETVETVWMPGGDGGERGDGSAAADEERDEPDDVARTQVSEARPGAPGSVGGYKRATICISSQVGCAVNCQFCLTAKLGIRRNLTAGEIAGQVAAVLNRQQVRIGSRRGAETPAGSKSSRINLVFMGMGEPFLNYDEFMRSVHVLRAMGIPESRMTVSTSGIEPSIRRFALEPVRPKLALSLNASNDGVREQIMPITRKWNIAALLDAVNAIPLGKREYVTFEYVLLGGVNDQPEHAREVLALLKGMKAKVNLIVWNPGPGIEYRQPTPEDVAVFHRMLIDGGIPTFTRRPRGRDIYAACGQLKRTLAEGVAGLVGIQPVA
jgi:23S rRNA (adenine2503-C2)-methyltransferase